MLAGLGVALVTLLARSSAVKPVRVAAMAYVEIIRNTPFLLQLFFVFFGLPTLGLRLGPNAAAFAALSLNAGAYVSEILRGGVAAVDRGQREAGFALGLSPFQIFRYVVVKPALRAIYPALTSQFILLLLSSSIVAAISANELTQAAQTLDSTTFRSFEIYFVVTGMYLAMSVFFSRLFRWLNTRMFAYPTR